MAHAGSRLKPTDCLERHRLESRPSSRTGENPPYGMIGRIEETSASYEARSAPRSYPTVYYRNCGLVGKGKGDNESYKRGNNSGALVACCRLAAQEDEP